MNCNKYLSIKLDHIKQYSKTDCVSRQTNINNIAVANQSSSVDNIRKDVIEMPTKDNENKYCHCLGPFMYLFIVSDLRLH